MYIVQPFKKQPQQTNLSIHKEEYLSIKKSIIIRKVSIHLIPNLLTFLFIYKHLLDNLVNLDFK